MNRWQPLTLNALRIVTGLLFMQHGAQKLFGALGGNAVESLASQMGLAGILEFFGGALIALGLFTRPVAFVLAGEMAWAYFQAHFPRAFFPITNRGELPVLYCFIYLYLAANGGGSFSLDGVLRRRKGEAASGAGAERRAEPVAVV
ncbi:MAG TPA: DoxX family protein [Longimicrobiales bacterium]